MTVASCPACHESVTVPVDAEPESVVRCPLCGEQFSMREFLTQLPPMLIVMEEGGKASDSADGEYGSSRDTSDWHGFGGVSVEKFPTKTAAVAEHEDAPAFDFVAGSAPGRESLREVDGGSRPARPPKNGLWEVAKIAAGGLLAVPCALLILLWLPGKWQRDPLSIGPDIGRVVPWIVPTNCRPQTPVDRPEDFLPEWAEPADRNQSDSARGGPPPDSERIVRRKANGGQRADLPNATGTAETQAKRSTAGEDTRGGRSGDEGAQESAGDLRDKSAGEAVNPDNATPSNGGRSPTAKPQTEQQRPVRAVAGPLDPGVVTATPRTPAELHQSLEAVVLANNAAWDASAVGSEEPEAGQIDPLFTAFARLGEAVTFVQPQGAGVRDDVESIQGLLMSLALRPAKLVAIGNRARDWLDESDRASDGILLFGTVTRIRPRGLYFETQLDLAARQKRSLTVVSKVDPRGAYAVKDRVLILGVIVLEPSQNLSGYAGTEPLVVMGGFPVNLGR